MNPLNLKTLLETVPIYDPRPSKYKYARDALVLLADIFMTLLHVDYIVCANCENDDDDDDAERDIDAEKDIEFERILLRILHNMNIADRSLINNRDLWPPQELRYVNTRDGMNGVLALFGQGVCKALCSDNTLLIDPYLYLTTDIRIHKFLYFFERFVIFWIVQEFPFIIEDMDYEGVFLRVDIDFMNLYHNKLIKTIKTICLEDGPSDPYENLNIHREWADGYPTDDSDDDDDRHINRAIGNDAPPLDNIPKIPEISKECCVCLESDQLLQLACYHICCYTCYGKISDKCPTCRETIVGNLTKRL